MGKKGGRLKAAIQARKETALEALRDGLWAVGTNIRPMRGRPGYGAVRLAMAHWRPDFQSLIDLERRRNGIIIGDTRPVLM